MPMITRLRAVWNGWSGAPGYTSIYLDGTPSTTGLDTAAAAFKTWLTGVANLIPSGLTIAIDSTVNRIRESDGVVTAVDPIPTPPTSVTGSGSTNFAAPAGAVIVWRTGVVNVRRLTVGRSFLVPLGQICFQNDGTLVDSTKTSLQGQAQTFVASLSGLTPGKMIVWRRPSAKGATDGAAVPVSAATVTDKVQILRSRRGR